MIQNLSKPRAGIGAWAKRKRVAHLVRSTCHAMSGRKQGRSENPAPVPNLMDRIGTTTRSSTCMHQCESVGSDVSQFRRRQSESVDGRQAIHRRTKLQPAAWRLSQQGEKGARQACGLVAAHREYIDARFSLFNRPPGMLSQSCCRVHLQMPAWTRGIPFHRRSRD